MRDFVYNRPQYKLMAIKGTDGRRQILQNI